MDLSVTSNTSSKRKRRSRQTKTYQRTTRSSELKRLKKSTGSFVPQSRDLTHDDDHKADEPPITTPSVMSTAPSGDPVDIPKSQSSNSTTKRRRRRRRPRSGSKSLTETTAEPPIPPTPEPEPEPEPIPKSVPLVPVTNTSTNRTRISHIVCRDVVRTPTVHTIDDEAEQKRPEQRVSHIVTSDDMKAKRKEKISETTTNKVGTKQIEKEVQQLSYVTQSCDIDLSVDDPVEFEYIRFKTKGINDWMYGQVIWKRDNILDVKVVDYKDEAHEIVMVDTKLTEIDILEGREKGKVMRGLARNERRKQREKEKEKEMEMQVDNEEEEDNDGDVVRQQPAQQNDKENVMENDDDDNAVPNEDTVDLIHSEPKKKLSPITEVDEDNSNQIEGDGIEQQEEEDETQDTVKPMDIDRDLEDDNGAKTNNVQIDKEIQDDTPVRTDETNVVEPQPHNVPNARKERAPFVAVNTPATETASMRMAVNQLSLPSTGAKATRPKVTKQGTEIMPPHSDSEPGGCDEEQIEKCPDETQKVSLIESQRSDGPNTITDVIADSHSEHSEVMEDRMDLDIENEQNDSKQATPKPKPVRNQKEENTDDEHEEFEHIENQNVEDIHTNHPPQDTVPTRSIPIASKTKPDGPNTTENDVDTMMVDIDDLDAQINALCDNDHNKNKNAKKSTKKKRSNRVNQRKESIIIVPDSDPSQNDEIEDNSEKRDSVSIASRPLQPLQPFKLDPPPSTPHFSVSSRKTRLRHQDINSYKTPTPHSNRKRTKRTPNSRSRKRPALALKDCAKTTKSTKRGVNDGLAQQSMALHQEKTLRNRLKRQQLVHGMNEEDEISTPYTANHGDNGRKQNVNRMNGVHHENQENVVPFEYERDQMDQSIYQSPGKSRKHSKQIQQRPLRQIQSRQRSPRKTSKMVHSENTLKSKSTPPDIRHLPRSPRSSKKRKRYEDGENEMDDIYGVDHGAPPRKKARTTVIVKEQGTQTEGGHNMIDVRAIQEEVSSKFKKLFNNLFHDKVRELRRDNEEFRRFLQEKAQRTTELHTEYGAKVKAIQNEVFSKMGKDILKKWKDDVMDSIEQLEEHASTIHDQQSEYERNRMNDGKRNGVDHHRDEHTASRMVSRSNSEDIVNQISNLLNSYNAV